MFDPTTFPALFQRTHRVIHMQTKDLTTADSLVQPPFRGNCLNWVLGHIVVSREDLLRNFGASLEWDAADLARYKRNAEPLTSSEQALSLEQLLAGLDRSQELIQAGFAQATAATWQTLVDDEPFADWVAFLHWHETYHVGQLELLRQLSGKNDKII